MQTRKRILIGMFAIVLSSTIALMAVLQVSAQGPSNTYPGAAQYADGQWRPIPGNTSLWFIFEYVGDRSEIQLTLTDGSLNNLKMDVFTPEQVKLPDSIHGTPIGRGAAVQVPCGAARCLSNDLTWAAKMYLAGIYYVQVLNPAATAKPMQIKAAGSGVFVREATATPTLRVAATPTFTRTRTPGTIAAPNAVITSMAAFAATMKAPVPSEGAAATTQPPDSSTGRITPTLTPTASTGRLPTPVPPEFVTAENFWPQNAAWVYDRRDRIIPGRSDLWFKFLYSGDSSLIEVRIPEGRARKLGFLIYDGDEVARKMQSAVSMGLGTVPPGSVDLTWSSKYSSPRTVYIRVTNENEGQVNFNLVVTGGVVLGQ